MSQGTAAGTAWHGTGCEASGRKTASKYGARRPGLGTDEVHVDHCRLVAATCEGGSEWPGSGPRQVRASITIAIGTGA